MTGTLLTILLLSQTAAPELTWQPSFSQAKIVAEKGSKPILVSFHTSWCGWCRKMDRITFRDPKVIARLATHVVLFSVDAEKDEDGVALAREHRIGSYPTQLLLDGTGSEIGRLSGFKDPLAFVRELDIVMEARLRLTRLLEEEAASPDDPRLLFELAMTLERGHRFAAAAERYVRLVEANKTTPNRYGDLALWNVAALYTRLEEAESAIAAYRSFVADYPASDRVETALYKMGRLQQRQGARKAAVTTYEDLLERFPHGRHGNGARLQLHLLRAAD